MRNQTITLHVGQAGALTEKVECSETLLQHRSCCGLLVSDLFYFAKYVQHHLRRIINAPKG